MGQTLRKGWEPHFAVSATKSNSSRDCLFYASFSVGAEGWRGTCAPLGSQDNSVNIYLRNQALKISKRNPKATFSP